MQQGSRPLSAADFCSSVHHCDKTLVLKKKKKSFSAVRQLDERMRDHRSSQKSVVYQRQCSEACYDQ